MINNEKYNQMIDEVYEKYLKNFVTPICPPNLDVQPSYYDPMTKDWFIKSAKERGLRGEEFFQKWGLRIKERELSLEERWELTNINGRKEQLPGEPYYTDEQQHSLLDGGSIPTRLIMITYNNETIEVYE